MNLKALYENLLSNQTPETINEASTQRVNVSPGQRILEGLSNEKAITSRRRAVKGSSRINENGSTDNLNKLKKVLKDVYGLTAEFEIYGDSLELLNAEAMKEIIDCVAKEEEDLIIVASDKNLYVIEYNIYKGIAAFFISEYQDAWAEGGVDPFEISRPIGRLAKNKALQLAWQSAGIGEEPDLEGINESRSRRREINESSQPMRIFHTETLEDYDALMIELGGYRIKPLVGHRWKEHGKNTAVFVHSEKGRFYMEYGSIVEATSKYPDVPIEKYKADKALQKAGQSVRSGEELDLEGINESRSRRREVKESISARDLPKNSNFPHEILDKRKNELKNQPSKGKIDNYFSDQIKEAISNKRIRPRIQEGSVKFPDLSKLKNSKKPKLLKEAAGDEEEFETPQDELEQDLDVENSTDSVEEETTGFSLDDAVLIDGDLVLTISKDSGHVVNITLTDIDLDEEVLVYAKSGEENEEEEERLSESAKLRKKFLSGKH